MLIIKHSSKMTDQTDKISRICEQGRLKTDEFTTNYFKR